MLLQSPIAFCYSLILTLLFVGAQTGKFLLMLQNVPLWNLPISEYLFLILSILCTIHLFFVFMISKILVSPLHLHFHSRNILMMWLPKVFAFSALSSVLWNLLKILMYFFRYLMLMFALNLNIAHWFGLHLHSAQLTKLNECKKSSWILSVFSAILVVQVCRILKKCKYFNIQTLSSRRNITEAIFINKLYNNKIDCSPILLDLSFYVPSRHLRQRDLFLNRSRINIRKFSPLLRAQARINESNLDIFDNVVSFKRKARSFFCVP